MTNDRDDLLRRRQPEGMLQEHQCRRESEGRSRASAKATGSGASRSCCTGSRRRRRPPSGASRATSSRWRQRSRGGPRHLDRPEDVKFGFTEVRLGSGAGDHLLPGMRRRGAGGLHAVGTLPGWPRSWSHQPRTCRRLDAAVEEVIADLSRLLQTPRLRSAGHGPERGLPVEPVSRASSSPARRAAEGNDGFPRQAQDAAWVGGNKD